jgi:hypothetical protein
MNRQRNSFIDPNRDHHGVRRYQRGATIVDISLVASLPANVDTSAVPGICGEQNHLPQAAT